jgi:hypothetical protein
VRRDQMPNGAPVMGDELTAAMNKTMEGEGK